MTITAAQPIRAHWSERVMLAARVEPAVRQAAHDLAASKRIPVDALIAELVRKEAAAA